MDHTSTPLSVSCINQIFMFIQMRLPAAPYVVIPCFWYVLPPFLHQAVRNWLLSMTTPQEHVGNIDASSCADLSCILRWYATLHLILKQLNVVETSFRRKLSQKKCRKQYGHEIMIKSQNVLGRHYFQSKLHRNAVSAIRILRLQKNCVVLSARD